MCHNSGVQSAQIEKCVEHGMPQKIVKTVKYTIKKRAEEHRKVSEAQFRSASTTGVTTSTTSTTSTSSESSQTSKRQELCPFFRKHGNTMDHIADIGGAPHFGQAAHSVNSSGTSTVYMDALAISTLWTKKLLVRLGRKVENLQSSKIYTLLTRTTQPAHVIAICILAFVLLTIWPEIIESTSAETANKTEQSQRHHLAVIAYLGAFATHFGAQIWMTFVSGLSLYFALPRHTFGQCQQILFPKYFALNAVLSISMIILFVKFFLGNSCLSGCIQLAALSLSAFIEVTVRLYLAPPMLRLMHEKYKIEGAVGSGQEVGDLVQGDLVQCPHYQRIHKMFRRIHMTVAIGNIVVLLCTCLHLYYLASKISFN